VTRSQLDRAVARETGETVRTVRARGFSVLPRRPEAAAAEDPRLVLDCPTCLRPVPYPGVTGDGAPALAECPACDAYFPVGPAAVYVAGPRPARSQATPQAAPSRYRVQAGRG
jgi:hypothetical protein